MLDAQPLGENFPRTGDAVSSSLPLLALLILRLMDEILDGFLYLMSRLFRQVQRSWPARDIALASGDRGCSRRADSRRRIARTAAPN